MMFPESWGETTVENVIIDLQPGFAQKPGEEDDGTTPQIRTHNITPDGKISLEGIKHISASAKESARYTLMKGDVLFNNTNSEEWVGKSAVFDQEGEYVFSNHMTRLRVNAELIMPEYLATYLHLLWSMGYSKTRAKRWVSQAGIDSATLASFKILLPSLSEQNRIVNLVKLTQDLRAKKACAIQLFTAISNALFEQYFGVAGASNDWLMEAFGKHTTYNKYGPRFHDQPYSDKGIHILRTTDMNSDGTIRWWEAPKLSLTDKQIQEYALKPNTLIISRSGTIGPFALFDGPDNQCVAGAYLIEFGLDDSVEPEYIRALFATPYIQQMLVKAVRSMAIPNINVPNIKSILIPIPPYEKQKSFAKQIKALRVWARTNLDSANKIEELGHVVVAEAFTGELTAKWRDLHAQEIAAEAITRDAFLRERGVKLKTVTPEPSVPETKAIESLSPARQWVVGELSGFQRQVLAAFLAYTDQPLIVEDENAFITFCDSDEVSERLQDFGAALNNRIRRALSQLAALGLIAKVTLPKYNEETGEREYLKAFRPLRETDFSRLSDIESIKRALNPPSEEQFYFLVHLDYETSERARAGGMFQVISIEDDEGKDFTYLVDQGFHYSSLDELGEDIASALKVSLHQIELEEV